MISKNKIKLIHSLESKKGRNESGCFLAEGNKLVGDIAPSFACQLLVATPEWMELHGQQIEAEERIIATSEEIKRASLLKNPQEVLAIFKKLQHPLEMERIKSGLTLALDDVQDPGNVGTIVRLADWFGIEHVICSPQCADIYNPKTVQATMGAIARVRVEYMPLDRLFDMIGNSCNIYGTFLDGEDLYQESLSSNGIIVMGNEGNGISPATATHINRRILIPSYPPERTTSESLNVATATAIVCAEFRRRG